MRRGSFVFVTRPSTVVPIGITVFPSITSGSVTLAEKGSPAFELKVASVVSSFILTAVPVGRAVCAPAKLAIRMTNGKESDASESVFFMLSFTSKIQLCTSFVDQLQSSKNVIERRAVVLVVAAVDVTHPPVAVDDEGGRVRDVDSVMTERVMESVVSGHGALLIEQERAGDGMLLKKLPRLPHAIAFFGGDECQLGSRRRNLRYPRLELSHALDAVRSPSAAQKLENQRALGQQAIESERALAMAAPSENMGEGADLQSLGAVLHVEFDFKRGGKRNNNGWGSGMASGRCKRSRGIDVRVADHSSCVTDRVVRCPL